MDTPKADLFAAIICIFLAIGGWSYLFVYLYSGLVRPTLA